MLTTASQAAKHLLYSFVHSRELTMEVMILMQSGTGGTEGAINQGQLAIR